MMGMVKVGDVVGYVDLPNPAQNKSWHIAQVGTGREEASQDFLKRHKFEVYYPMMRVMKITPRKLLSHKQRLNGAVVKRPFMMPLFPSYLLINFDLEDGRWHNLFEMIGVRGLVCNGNLPASIPAIQVNKLKGLEVDGAVPGTTPLKIIPFVIGEQVRIKTGPFATFPAIVEKLPSGTIEELDESMRVQLLVSIFGGSAPVDIEIGNIEKV